MKQLKKIPIFKSEDEEREFWANADSTDYVDWNKKEASLAIRAGLCMNREIIINENKPGYDNGYNYHTLRSF